MIKQVSHSMADTNPAGIVLALTVTLELHAPAVRAPEVAVPQLMGLRIPATRTHRRKVVLSHLDRVGA